MTVSWTFQHYLFWDPYSFSSQNRFPGWTGEGTETKDAKIHCVSLLVDIYFFLNLRQTSWGILEIWRFECNTSTRCLFKRQTKYHVFYQGNGGDVRKIFVLVSQVDFSLQISNVEVAMSLKTLGFLDLQWFPTRILQRMTSLWGIRVVDQPVFEGEFNRGCPSYRKRAFQQSSRWGRQNCLTYGRNESWIKTDIWMIFDTHFHWKKSFFVCLFACLFLFQIFFFIVKHELNNLPCFWYNMVNSWT